jgi:uncharacterized membrane protein (DUF4010 family)
MLDATAPLLSPFTDLSGAAAVLAAALGCGLLVGIERERRKGSGPGRAFAGLRTFAVTSVLGAATALTQLPGLVVTGALLVAALAFVAYERDRSEDPGATTELALLLTYVVGVLCAQNLALAAALAVGLTGVLAGRDALHRFARQWLTPGEVRDGIVLAALVLMALPLVPNRPFWGPVLNPHVIVQLLALLLAVQALAHLCRRLLQAQHAVAFSALASGFVSSTATIATLGLAVREGRSPARLMAGGGLLSCVSTQLQMLLVAGAVQPAWLSVLWGPVLAGSVLALAWGWWLVRSAPDAAPSPAAPLDTGTTSATSATTTTPETSATVITPTTSTPPAESAAPHEDRMFSLWAVAGVAALLSGIQAAVYGLTLWLGATGLLLGSALAALADLHAALAAVFASGMPLANSAAVWAAMLAMMVHTGSKSLTAFITGGSRYLVWLAPGLWLHMLLSVAGLYAMVVGWGG